MNNTYVVPWNQLRSFWIAYFGPQEGFPQGVSMREVRDALRQCMRFINSPGVNVDEMTSWKERFERWINEAEDLTRANEESGNYDLHT